MYVCQSKHIFDKIKKDCIILIKILHKYLVLALCVHRCKFGVCAVTSVPSHFSSWSLRSLGMARRLNGATVALQYDSLIYANPNPNPAMSDCYIQTSRIQTGGCSGNGTVSRVRVRFKVKVRVRTGVSRD